MIEEQQQADILEEHIPKVSDNIFLIHEKKQHRFPSAPAPKTITPETSLTASVTTLAVDNVIIIEKGNQDAVDAINLANSSDSVFEEEKEYPKAGIVHRLLGRFQTEKHAENSAASSTKKTHFHPPVDQRSKSTESIKPTPNSIPSAPTPYNTPIEEKSPPDLVIEESPTRTHAMPSDLLSPLLMSSAKPFTRQTTNVSGHGFHHVNVPVRKVTAPTSPKYTPLAKVDTAPKEKNPEPLSSSFTEDLSSLHSNRDVSPVIPIKETIIIETEEKIEESALSKRANLTNGDTLHSSGNEPLSEPVPPKRPTRFPEQQSKLQDKSNFSAFHFTATEEVKKSEKSMSKPTSFEPHKKETIVIPKQPEIIKPTEPKMRPSLMKENRGGYVPMTKKRDKSENQFKKVVNESLDESMLKSQAAIAANNIMKSSKTFKITPSRSAQKGNSTTPSPSSKPPPSNVQKSEPTSVFPKANEVKSPPVQDPVLTPAAEVISNGPVSQPTPPIPLRRHEVDNAEKSMPQSVKRAPPPPRIWPPVKPPNSLPTTSIDDIIDSPDSMTISPVSSLSVSPPETKEAVKVEPVIRPKAAVITEPPKEVKPQNSFSNRTAPNTISITPKSEPVKNQSIFGPRVTKSSSSTGRGKSFTIDPSKFRKSSAQPPSTTSSYTASQEVSNTRKIVPGSKGVSTTETDFGGDAPKTGKRKLTVDQITVIGGYVTLEKSCLVKDNKRKKSVTLSFSEKDLETTYTYASERSLLEEDLPNIKKPTKSPGFAKDSTIGKYTPKYLLSLKATELLDDDDDTSESKTTSVSSLTQNNYDSAASTPVDANPLPDDNAAAWSDTTSNSTDILF